MGGRPKVHSPGSGDNGEYELGYYRLNLKAGQLDEVARKLAIPVASEFRSTLAAAGGLRQPADGQEMMVTFKGRYVRITYQQGEAVKITPTD